MNIYDIAKQAGVSVATVSRVINNGIVKEQTRQRIQAIIDQNNYIPNVLAQGLNYNSQKTIGIIVSDIYDLYYSKAVSILESEFRTLGYDILLCSTGEELKAAERYVDLMLGKKVDGIFFIGSKFKSIEQKVQLGGIASMLPIVMINSETKNPDIISVVSDDTAAVADVVKTLFERGHRDFLYLYDTETPGGKKKLDGFQKGMKQCGLPVLKDNILKQTRYINGAKAALIKYLSEHPQTTAIVTAQDELAVGALKAAIELGIPVPERLEIVGYNNSVLTKCCTPELSSIDNKVKELCLEAILLFRAVKEGKPVKKKKVIPCSLVKLGTTRK